MTDLTRKITNIFVYRDHHPTHLGCRTFVETLRERRGCRIKGFRPKYHRIMSFRGFSNVTPASLGRINKIQKYTDKEYCFVSIHEESTSISHQFRSCHEDSKKGISNV